MKNKQLIEQIVGLLIPHFSRKKLIPVEEEYNLVCDLFSLLKEYVNENVGDACKYIVKYAIPYIQTCIGKERKPEKLSRLYTMLKECYCYAGRKSLEHFILFYGRIVFHCNTKFLNGVIFLTTLCKCQHQ